MVKENSSCDSHVICQNRTPFDLSHFSPASLIFIQLQCLAQTVNFISILFHTLCLILSSTDLLLQAILYLHKLENYSPQPSLQIFASDHNFASYTLSPISFLAHLSSLSYFNCSYECSFSADLIHLPCLISLICLNLMYMRIYSAYKYLHPLLYMVHVYVSPTKKSSSRQNNHNLPLHRISANLNGTYSITVSSNATSNPISPVVRAIGPTNQTWSIQGMTSAKLKMLAAIAGIPDGNSNGEFQIVML